MKDEIQVWNNDSIPDVYLVEQIEEFDLAGFTTAATFATAGSFASTFGSCGSCLGTAGTFSSVGN